MSLYSIMLFLHVSSAICLGVASAVACVRARGAGASERSNQHEGDSA